MKKKIFVVITVLVMLVGVGVGVYLVQQSAEFREKAAPASTLAFSSSSLNPTVGQEFIVTSTIDTGENQVIATETYITYDPSKIELTRVTLGSFFANPEEIGPSIDNNTGLLSHTQYLLPGSSPQTGQGSLAVLYFTAKAEGSATIGYTQDSIVGAVQEDGQNVLAGTTPLTLNIQSGAQPATATPTPTILEIEPTSTPSPTPTGEDDNGIGGEDTTPTPTPTSTSQTATSTPTSTSSGQLTSTPTTTQELMDSGISAPTLAGLAAGLLIIIGGLSLAF